jgi:hypothetical protein
MISKELFRQMITVVLVVTLLAAAVYYFVPAKTGLSGIVFALGPSSQLAGDKVVSELPTIHLLASFINGSYVMVFEFNQDQDVYTGEVDARDLKSIYISGGLSQAAVGVPDKLTVNLLNNRTVYSSLKGNGTVDLGTSQIIGEPSGFMTGNDYALTGNWTDMPIDANNSDVVYTTGHWKGVDRFKEEDILGRGIGHCGEFQLNVSELHEVLGNGFYQANLTFNLDYDIMLRYELVDQGKTTYGDASLHWSGELGTIQFTYDQNGLTSMKYDFRAIKLVAFPT